MCRNLNEVSIGVHISARRRHQEGTKFSHFEGSWEKLIGLVRDSLVEGKYSTGKVSDALVICLDKEGFCSRLGAQYDSKCGWIKEKAREIVEIIIYNRAGIINDGSRPSTNCDYEIVSIHA
jgi:hypothetical protein